MSPHLITIELIFNERLISYNFIYLLSDSASTKKNLFRFAAVGCTILLAVSGTFLLMKSTRPSQVVSIQQSSVFEEATQEETSAPSIRKNT